VGQRRARTPADQRGAKVRGVIDAGAAVAPVVPIPYAASYQQEEGKGSRVTRRILAALVLAGAVLLPLLIAPPAIGAQCQMRYSFQELRDAIPAVVGDCTAGEFQAPNGDVLQPTTRGLLVRRAVDNWSEFTNGAFTWGIGPNGLAKRRNSDRFPWELTPPTPAPTASGAEMSPTATPVYLTSGAPASPADMTGEGAATPTPTVSGTPGVSVTPTVTASTTPPGTPTPTATATAVNGS
jgi:hypothetical protein